MRVLRCAVHEDGHGPLPELDVDDDPLVIGSGAGAHIRLPAVIAVATHVVVEQQRWRAMAAVVIDGAARDAGAEGSIGDGIDVVLGGYRVRIAPAPDGALASPPQRTESLARELVRAMLGSGAAPRLEVERGPAIGVARTLPPPVATLVIGRGDEAQWIIGDEDLSRAHAELRRGWDGVTIRDLGSKNGTRVDGVVVTATRRLHDGEAIELGNIVLRYRDPAEQHLRGGPPPAAAPTARAGSDSSVAPMTASAVAPFVIAATIAVVAVAGMVWVLVS